jgi:hypothetical protein
MVGPSSAQGARMKSLLQWDQTDTVEPVKGRVNAKPSSCPSSPRQHPPPRPAQPSRSPRPKPTAAHVAHKPQHQIQPVPGTPLRSIMFGGVLFMLSACLRLVATGMTGLTEATASRDGSHTERPSEPRSAGTRQMNRTR